MSRTGFPTTTRIAANGTFDMHRGAATFAARYRPSSPEFEPRAGTLEHFLTERYCLYADAGRARADIHHRPWRLRGAEADVTTAGLSPVPLEGDPLCHVAERQDVVVFPLGRI